MGTQDTCLSSTRCCGVQARASVRLFRCRGMRAITKRARVAICTARTVGECCALLGHYGRNVSVTDCRPTRGVGGRVRPPLDVLTTLRSQFSTQPFTRLSAAMCVAGSVPVQPRRHIAKGAPIERHARTRTCEPSLGTDLRGVLRASARRGRRHSVGASTAARCRRRQAKALLNEIRQFSNP